MDTTLGSFRRNASERMSAHIAIPVLCLSAFGVSALAVINIIPVWLVFLTQIALSTRIVSLSHELIHSSPVNVNWNFLLRLNMHIYTPLTVGFGELRKLHLLHHQYTNTDNDPDYPVIKGTNKLRSLLGLAFMAEHWFIYVLKHHLISPNFWHLWVIRCIILIGFIYMIGFQNYLLLYLLPLKVASMVVFLMFSYEVHTDDNGAHKDSYNVHEWPVINPLLRLFTGQTAYNSTVFHATHHRYPWISGWRLPDATDYYLRQKKEQFSVRRLLSI